MSLTVICIPPFGGRVTLRNAFDKLEGFEFEHIASLEKLPDNLRRFSALVLYFHHKKISDQALAKLDAFVFNGGGILGIHSATASFKEQMHYFEILGGRFVGHGKVETFNVTRVKDEIFSEIVSFTVKDELYFHAFQPGINVHFTAKHEGKDIPVVWTYQFGLGRVCYAVPGHLTESMKNKNYQKLLQCGMIWVSENE